MEGARSHGLEGWGGGGGVVTSRVLRAVGNGGICSAVASWAGQGCSTCSPLAAFSVFDGKRCFVFLVFRLFFRFGGGGGGGASVFSVLWALVNASFYHAETIFMQLFAVSVGRGRAASESSVFTAFSSRLKGHPRYSQHFPHSS